MSNRVRVLLAVALLGGCGTLSAASGPPACPPGCIIVEEVCYQEVVRKCCKVVPDVKKLTRRVHAVKPDDYCLTKCPCPLHCGKGCETDCCPMCDKPRCRNLLLKREITEEHPCFKCVVECVVETVPVKVYRVVPCPPAPCPPAAPAHPAPK